MCLIVGQSVLKRSCNHGSCWIVLSTDGTDLQNSSSLHHCTYRLLNLPSHERDKLQRHATLYVAPCGVSENELRQRLVPFWTAMQRGVFMELARCITASNPRGIAFVRCFTMIYTCDYPQVHNVQVVYPMKS